MPNSPPLPTLKNSRDHIQAPPGGLMLPGFPASEPAWIDAHSLGHFLLRQAEFSARGSKALRECGGRGSYPRNWMMVGR